MSKKITARELDDRLGRLFQNALIDSEVEVLVSAFSMDDNARLEHGNDENRSGDEAVSNVGPLLGSTSRTPAVSGKQPPVKSSGLQEFRAAAASGGNEKPRALPGTGMDKILLGQANGAKGKCSFHGIGDRVFVEFDHGQASPRISLRGLPTETYALSPAADADGHYEIVGIKAADVAQFLALRRKPRW